MILMFANTEREKIMKELIMLKPILKEAIWGGDILGTKYQYDIPSDHTGECWGISAHKNGDCVVREGTYEGKTLSYLWENHRELFGNAKGDVFPLLVKIIDAKEDLSIQVHPDDEYACTHEEGALGKTECWYVLECEDDAQIVIGHNAKTKEELKELIEEKKWNELIRKRPIKKGDFFQITPGTVHAIKGGTVILETQQSSDITYRLYDYDRLSNGIPRELHLKQSMDVITCPQQETSYERKIIKLASGTVEQLISCEFYTVCLVKVHGKQSFEQEHDFYLVSVIEGSGTLNGYHLHTGDHFIIPSGYGTCNFEGELELIISYI